MIKQKRTFLITGFARSGTRYMSQLFKSFGFDIRHERMGRDGISSWIFGGRNTDVKYYLPVVSTINRTPKPDPKFYEFDEVFVVVREPIKTISSFLNLLILKKLFWNTDFIERYFELDWVDGYMSIATQCTIGWYEMLREYETDAVFMKTENAEAYFLDRFKHPISILPPHNVSSLPNNFKIYTENELKHSISAKYYEKYLKHKEFYEKL